METITTVWSQLVADQHFFAVLVTTAVGMNGSWRACDDRSFDVIEQFDVAAHVITHATHCCSAVVGVGICRLVHAAR